MSEIPSGPVPAGETRAVSLLQRIILPRPGEPLVYYHAQNSHLLFHLGEAKDCDTVEELVDWWRSEIGEDQPWKMRTKQTPKRAGELEDGGSLYRVFKGFILCRQEIRKVETVGEGAASRCEIELDPEIVRVVPTPRRAFQGWRYLDPKDAPPDLAQSGAEDVPPELARQLREAGAW